MNRPIGSVLLAMAWVALIWGGLDDDAYFVWQGKRTSVAFFAAPLLAVAIWLLLRGDSDEEPAEFD